VGSADGTFMVALSPSPDGSTVSTGAVAVRGTAELSDWGASLTTVQVANDPANSATSKYSLILLDIFGLSV
jgi:hypothetical protein